MTAIDYAAARYSSAQLRAAGVDTVFRYVGPPGWGKTITQVEYNELTAGGIAVYLVFEYGANDAAGGFDAGVANAHTAMQWAPQGYSGPIFFAADEDLYGAALDAAVQYVRGAAAAIGTERTGDYGPGALCQATHDAGYATYHWQSASTSFNGNAVTLPITHVQQGFGGPLADTDVDYILLPLQPPVVNFAVTDPDLEMLMSLAANPVDALNVYIRDKWATYRTDPLTTPAREYLRAGYNGPWGGSLDFVLATIIDNATVTGHLRPQFAGAA